MIKNILFIFFTSLMMVSLAQTTQRLSPDFTAVTIDEDTMTLSDILLNQQKYVALEFFFNESELCGQTSQIVTEAYQNLGMNQTDVIFISVNVGSDSSACRSYMDSLLLLTPIVAGTDGGDEISEAYDIQAFPTLILISPSLPDTLIAIDSIPRDTTIGGVDTTVIDVVPYKYNIVENDIWPINNVNDILSVLTSYNGITGISNPTKETFNSFEVFPNPSSGIFYLTSDVITGNFDYQIIDISGKVVYSSELVLSKNQRVSLDVSFLNKGIYFLKLQKEGSQFVEKLIIQ